MLRSLVIGSYDDRGTFGIRYTEQQQATAGIGRGGVEVKAPLVQLVVLIEPVSGMDIKFTYYLRTEIRAPFLPTAP